MKANQALEFFAASDAKPVASTANEKDGTIDVVWYTGAQVPRKDPDTGDPYMLTLDMGGARLDRLNAGAPVFDTHFTGDDYKSCTPVYAAALFRPCPFLAPGPPSSGGTVALPASSGCATTVRVFSVVRFGVSCSASTSRATFIFR